MNHSTQNEAGQQPPRIHKVPFAGMLLFAVGVLFCLFFAVKFGMNQIWMGTYLGLAGIAFFGSFSWLLYTFAFIEYQAPPVKSSPHTDFVDLSTIDQLVMQQGKVKEVLIARFAQDQFGRTSRTTFYKLGAYLVLKCEEQNGELAVMVSAPLTLEEHQKQLDEQIARLRERNIPVYASDFNFNELRAADIAADYDRIPKQPYDDDAPFYLKETALKKHYRPLRIPSLHARYAAQAQNNDRKFYIPIYRGLILLNLLFAIVWIPFWISSDTGFVWAGDIYSGSLALNAFNLTVLCFVGRYWRDSLKKSGCRVLVDALLITMIQLTGVFLAQFVVPVESTHYQNLLKNNGWMGIALIFVFIFVRVATKSNRVEASPPIE